MGKVTRIQEARQSQPYQDRRGGWLQTQIICDLRSDGFAESTCHTSTINYPEQPRAKCAWTEIDAHPKAFCFGQRRQPFLSYLLTRHLKVNLPPAKHSHHKKKKTNEFTETDSQSLAWPTWMLGWFQRSCSQTTGQASRSWEVSLFATGYPQPGWAPSGLRGGEVAVSHL